MRDIQQNVQLFEAEKKDLQDEREHLMKTRAQLELLVKDLEDSQMSEEEYKVNGISIEIIFIHIYYRLLSIINCNNWTMKLLLSKLK